MTQILVDAFSILLDVSGSNYVEQSLRIDERNLAGYIMKVITFKIVIHVFGYQITGRMRRISFFCLYTLSMHSLLFSVLPAQGNLFLSLNRPDAAVTAFRGAQELKPDLRSYQGNSLWCLLLSLYAIFDHLDIVLLFFYCCRSSSILSCSF